MRRMLMLVGVAVALYGLWALLLFTQQRRMMYAAWGAPVPARAGTPVGVVTTWIEVPGARVEAWYLPPLGIAAGPAGAVVFAHGNGETIDAWPRELENFRALGLGVLLIEYPGYGRSSGEPT